MVEAGRQAVQAARHRLEALPQAFFVARADRPARPFLQAVFDKVLELPHVEAKVEALLEGDAGVVSPAARPLDLDAGELDDRLLVPF